MRREKVEPQRLLDLVEEAHRFGHEFGERVVTETLSHQSNVTYEANRTTLDLLHSQFPRFWPWHAGNAVFLLIWFLTFATIDDTWGSVQAGEETEWMLAFWLLSSASAIGVSSLFLLSRGYWHQRLSESFLAEARRRFEAKVMSDHEASQKAVMDRLVTRNEERSSLESARAQSAARFRTEIELKRAEIAAREKPPAERSNEL